jgi:hypothetical protein
MVDWCQGYDVPAPLESLGEAVSAARKAILVAEAQMWHPCDVRGMETRVDEQGNTHWRTIRKVEK